MLNCKEAVKIISTEDRAHWRRKIRVRLHLLICHHCSKYAKQIEALRSGVRAIFESKKKQATDQKIKDLEQKIISNLK
jgi:anti-sigma factor ChrR (cupin superfamily)